FTHLAACPLLLGKISPAPCVSKISSPGQPDAECQTSQAYSLLDIIKEPAVQGSSVEQIGSKFNDF
ncbi:TPA: hypothetical protein ACRQYD_004820, partial [Escherichia coli]